MISLKKYLFFIHLFLINGFILSQEQDTLNLPFNDGIWFNQPVNLIDSLSYDNVNNQISVNQFFGSFFLRNNTYFSHNQYRDYILNKELKEYWKTKISSKSIDLESGGAIPKINLGKEVLNKIFGSDLVSIRPQGAVELTFSGVVNKIDNPALPEAQRQTTSFNFDERIQINVIGRIGEKLQLQANYDTEATFEFENEMKLEYTGDEDDIIKNIELGNVNLPLSGSLITGVQSLFGIKAKMQFGRATLTTVFSEQKSETSILEIEGGAQTMDFEISIDNYEQNRHFFLSQYFYDQYDQFLAESPIINSPVNITKIEVYVTNKNSSTTNTRNILAFQDIGESNNLGSSIVIQDQDLDWPSNLNNSLNPIDFIDEIAFQTGDSIRNVEDITSAFSEYEQNGLQFYQSIDYEKVENARRLLSSEYTFNSKLGFISLNQALNSDEVLAVAFQYTHNGVTYQVGEFSSDVTAPDVLVLKLLKSTMTDVSQPIWKLMMKNVYGLGAYQVNREDFVLDIFYENPELGTPVNFLTEGDIANNLLLQVFNLDKLNSNNDPGADGVFDFIEGVTIQSSNGRIYFPMTEPFGCFLREKLGGNCDNIDPNSIASKYAFEALYDSTQSAAQQIPDLNRFLLRGQYKSSVSSEISLNAMNIPQGSVRVTSGGTQLEENIHYTVDYTMGSVKIIDQGILNSSQPIMISLENNSLFNFQSKRFMGAHLDYRFNQDFILGASILNLTEKPLTQKINIGDEPISNTIWGFNGSFSTESRFLTKMIDKIPLIETKEKSTFSIVGEFAHFIPGHPKSIDLNSTGTSYVDDFENSQSTIDIRSAAAWFLSSTPTGNVNTSGYFPEAFLTNDLAYGYNRAQLAWYVIDPLFQRNSAITPSHIQQDENQQNNNYVREVLITEIFPNKDIVNGQPSRLRTFDLAFYPKERGPYNFDILPTAYSSGINESGFLNDPETRWGGMMREIETNDFEAANIEFIEFWMMDPFIDDPNTLENESMQTGGDFFINIGNISEDILKDSRKSFENGLPIDGGELNIDTTIWGKVPTIQSLVNAFDNESASRENQDVGYDGMDDELERFFIPPGNNSMSYVDSVGLIFTQNSNAYIQAFEDPAADNFRYFRGSDFDQNETSILDRYKLYNGVEGNSPTSDQSSEDFPTSATNLPNVEDINNDQTLSEVESYYQYKVSLRPEDLIVGSNFITDEIVNVGPDNNARWLQFKIPIYAYEDKIGTIQDFKSIRFLRFFFNGFSEKIICRFASLELVRGEWRRYNSSLIENEENAIDSDAAFDISVVNIEENGSRLPINYVLPPGIERETIIGATSLQQQNEQSMVLKVIDLEDGDARATFKNVNMDMRNYQRIKMFIHAESIEEDQTQDGEMVVFIRMGSDYINNYYEYEIPLKITSWGESDPNMIWPLENEFDIPFSLFQTVKQMRNELINNSQIEWSYADLFEYEDGQNKVSVKGNPNLGDVNSIMIGVRNKLDDGVSKSVEIWVNELRLTDFNEQGGWASRMQMKLNLADLGSVAFAGSVSTVGFGSLEKNVSERNIEETRRYNVSSSFELGKFFPEKSNVRIPMYFSVSEDVQNPQYNPLDPDILLDAALDAFDTKSEKDSIQNIVQDYTKRKSINFTNIRKERKAGSNQSKIYDIENLALSYSYNETFFRNINTEYSFRKEYNGGVSYNFNNNPKNIKPFSKIKFLRKGKYLRMIRDFNFYYLPKQISFRTDVFRSYLETKLRNNSDVDFDIEPTFSKYFSMNRASNFKYDLTRSLKLNFSSNSQSIIDEPSGRIDTQEEVDSILNNVFSFGRPTEYRHNFDVRYTLPINKIPIFSWINTNINYDASYDWRASSLSAESFGNTIQNTNSIKINTQISLSSLYNKVPLLKKLLSTNTNKKRPSNNRTKEDDSSQKEKDEKEKDEKENNLELLKSLIRPIFAVKNFSISYTETNGTFLPGFLPQTGMLGMDNSFSSSQAPTLGFVLGSQADIRDLAASRGWLTTDPTMSNLFSRTNTVNLNLRSTIEPLPRFKIMLTASRRYALNESEYFRNEPDENGNPNWQSISPTRTGNFNISFVAIKTSFINDGVDNSSQLFNNFVNYRFDIAQRLGVEDGLFSNSQSYPNGYGPNSQEVLIPAFLAAYSGTNPDKQSLNNFPSIPLPNWNINYDGLIKIKWFKERFKNISMTHSYRSTYSIGSFISNLNFGEPDFIFDSNGNYLPEYQIDQVAITEQFAPFLKFDMTMKNSVTARIEYKKDRSISLSLANSQVTEVKGNEYVAGLGYRIQDIRLLFNAGFDDQNIKSDLDLRADFSLRKNKTIIRKIEELSNQPTSGQILLTLKFSADYVIGNKLNIKLFYDQVITDYVVSSSFPTSNTNVGLSIRYNLN